MLITALDVRHVTLLFFRFRFVALTYFRKAVVVAPFASTWRDNLLPLSTA